MELVQSRIVTDDVARLAGFYASLLRVPVALNDYYVEVQAGPASVGFSRRRFTEYRDEDADGAGTGRRRRDEVILDFLVDDVDAEYPRIAAGRRVGAAARHPALGEPVDDLPRPGREPGQRVLQARTRSGLIRGHAAPRAAGCGPPPALRKGTFMVINVTEFRPAGRSGPGPEHGVIVAEELVKTYPGGVRAVRGISF